jgi:hypothetical protein
MERELARKRPAVVVNASPVASARAGEFVIIKAASRGQLAAEVTRRWRAGEIEREYKVGRRGTEWVAACVPKAPRPQWLRPALWVAGGLAGLGLLLWVVKLLLAALSALLATLVGVIAPFLIGGLVLFVILGLMSGGRTIEIIQKVKIKG